MQREIGSNFWIAPKDLETEAAVITPAELGCGGSDFAEGMPDRGRERFQKTDAQKA